MPSLVLGEAFPPGRREPGRILAVLTPLVAQGWYQRAEIPVPETARERAILRQLHREHGLKFTCWASEILAREGLNLSALDDSIRRRSVVRCGELLRFAADCGADAIGLLGGPDPGPVFRAAAMAALEDSLVNLGRAASRLGTITVVIEPLDHAAHKCGLVGPTLSAVQLMKMVERETDRVRLGWDSGHMALNGEDLVASLRLAAAHTFQIHLSNPVTDPTDPRFGDHHYAIGEFGAGTPAEFSRLLTAARGISFPMHGAISVALEVRPPLAADPATVLQQTENHLRTLLEAANRPP